MNNMLGTKKFIIAHPMDSYHPTQGGGIRYLMNVLGNLKDLGWEPIVVGVKSGDKIPEDKNWQQIALTNEKRRIALFQSIPYWFIYLLKLYLLLPFLSIPRDAVILTHRIDCMLAFVIYKRKNPKVLISAAPGYYLRVSHPRLYKSFGWIYRFAEKICVRGIDVIVPTDEKTRQYYLTRYPYARYADENIPSSIVLKDFKHLSEEQARNSLCWNMHDRIVLFSGRFVAVKNIPLLIRAFNYVIRQVPNTRLVLVGDGEDWENIVGLVQESQGHIDLVGRIDPAQMYLYYAASDVLVLCSVEEGSPTVVKEALACGTPVISTDVGDVAELLSENPLYGCIVEPEEKSLAQAIVNHISSPRTLEQRISISQVACKFDNRIVGEKIEKIFMHACFQRAKRN